MNGIRSKFWALIGILCIATAAYTVSLTVPQSMTVRESASAERASAQGAPKAITTASAISSKPSASVANAVRPLFAAPVWGKAVLPPLLPSSSKASREILATGTIKASAFTAFKDLRKGQHVVLPFGEHDIDGVINLVKLGAEQDEIAGVFADGTRGSFFLSQMGPNRDQLAGQVLLVGEGVGYEILPTDHGLVVNKKPIQSLFCMGMPPAPHPVAQAAASTSPQAITVPVLDSLPGSRGVLYLDFDGEVVTDGSWNGGVTIFASAAVVNGLPISAAQITDIWRRVSEDFKPFNVSVTTDESRYASAPIGERMRCIITPTNSWYSNAGGVAYVGSYRGPYVGYSVDIPCWVFNTYNTSDIALAASHELGHTLGLSHDGATLSSGHEEYYPGHDTFFPASWGAIMGAPYDIVVTQWSKGEYPFANNFEDDLKVMADTIAKGGFVVGTIPDDVGNSIATAGSFGVSGTINQPGTISTNTDGDYYEFKTKGGSVTINAVVDTPDPDLDSQLILYDSAGNTVATSAINANLASSITTTLVSGQFFVQITNKGRAAAPADPPTSTPARIGYSTYGSMGSYTLTGSFLPLPLIPFIKTPPAGFTANQGTKNSLSVVSLSNTAVSYQWKKDGKILPGKTAAVLAFASIQPGDAGSYTVDVKNSVGTVTSDPAVVVVHYKPVITVNPLPAAKTVATGDTVTYSVTANGIDGVLPNTLTYLWKRNGVAISPAETNPSLTLTNVDWFNAATYTCVVTNAMGSTTSLGAALTVTSGPLFTLSPPATKHIPLAGTSSVAVTVVGTPPIQYQWFTAGGVKVPGATKSILSWAAIKSTAAGEYYVVATNSKGFTESSHMMVDVQAPPKITTDPATKLTLNADDTLSLTCAATGDPALVYQWQHNNVNLVNGGRVSGADTASLTVTPATWTDQGTYRCIVTNAVGSATTKVCTVTLVSYPVILTPPTAMKIATGGSGILKVVAGGTPALKYQWYKDSAPIDKAVGPTLTLAKASALATNGMYSVTVTNTQSPTTGVSTTPVQVTVLDSPKFTLQPLKVISGVAQAAHFVVAASGGGTLSLQWQKNNKDIPGQTMPNLDMTNLALTDAGTFRCIVKNDVGTATSLAVPLTVLIPPSITGQPVSVVAYETISASFTTLVSGSPPLVYQWSKDDGTGTFLPVPATNATAKTSVLKFTPVTLAAGGNYRMSVANAAGTVYSNVVVLSAKAAPAPTIVDFTPHQERISDTLGVQSYAQNVIIFGSNLAFITKVRFGTTVASFAHTNDSELLVTVPQTLTVATPITIETPSGSATTTSSFIPYSATYLSGTNPPLNDNLINAQLVLHTIDPGPTNAPGCENTYATFESNENEYYGKTVWYHWRPPSTGTYHIDTAGSNFEPYLTVYSGPPVPNMSSLSYVDSNFGGLNKFVWKSYAEIEHYFVKGNDYYLQIDSSGDHLFKILSAGTLALTINHVANDKMGHTTVARPSVVRDASANGPLTALVGEGAAGAEDASLVWPIGTASRGAVISASADVVVDTAGTAESFAWTLADSSGARLFDLTFDCASQKVLCRAPTGQTALASQPFDSGKICQISIEVDASHHFWTAKINGVTVLDKQPVSTALLTGGSAKVALHWTPAPGSTSGGTLKCGRLVGSSGAAPLAK